jgi:hypothetical protein
MVAVHTPAGQKCGGRVSISVEVIRVSWLARVPHVAVLALQT